ncbi:MAG: electron transport complex subunit RsxC [Gammaproteobacteria bacterium]
MSPFSASVGLGQRVSSVASERVSQVWKFPGGLRLPPHKSASTTQPIAIAPAPAIAVLPLLQHTGAPATPVVKPGAQVLTGEPIASAEDHIGAPLHASVSGKVIAIENRPVPHPGGLSAPCIVIEADGRDQHYEGYAPVADHLALEPSEIGRLVGEAGIVGLGGAVFPTSVKLRTAGGAPLEALILNGAECEPWISCDDMLMRERADSVVLGAQIMLHALQAGRCVIAIEHDKPEAIAALEAASAGDKRFEVIAVTTAYPAGGERQLIQVLTHREVPTGRLPPDIGYLMQNVATAAAVAQRFRDGRPLISRIVTVAGDGIASPRNFEARLGTPFSALAAEAGGYSGEVARVVMGGPMMGFAVPTDEVPVVKATNCIWAATARDVRATDDEMPCIRCGECARVCPAVLLPQQLYWYTRAGDFDKVLDYALFDCIECGCCDFVCPSHIPLTGYFRFAKSEITAREADRARAARAKWRHEIHTERIARRESERVVALEARRPELQAAPHGRADQSDPIREIMRRVEKKESASDDPSSDRGGD